MNHHILRPVSFFLAAMLLSGCGKPAASTTASSAPLPAAAPAASSMQQNLPEDSLPFSEDKEPSFEEKAAEAMSSLPVWDGSIAESFDGGDGSSSNPYQIATGAQLAKLAADANNGISFSGSYFVLTSDILLNDICEWDFEQPVNIFMNPTLLDEWQSFSPIFYFEGSFDGAGHTVYGLYHTDNYNTINSTVGLFGEAKNANISNLSVACSLLRPLCKSVGGIVGYLRGGSLTNCHSQQVIIAATAVHVGGVCGEGSTGSSISDCTFSGQINANPLIGDSRTTDVGGITGGRIGTISRCYSDCTIRSDLINGISKDIGGIAAIADHIDSCYFNGDIQARVVVQPSDIPDQNEFYPSDFSIGGIAGEVTEVITNCGSSGPIQLEYGLDAEMYLDACIGGIAGSLIGADVSYCYAAGELVNDTPRAYTGGIAGSAQSEFTSFHEHKHCTVTNCFYSSGSAEKAVNMLYDYNGDRSSSVFTDQVKGLSDAEFLDAGSYPGWDFNTGWTLDKDINGGLPVPASLVSYFSK